MPTYEYACGSCGEHVEVVQSFSDEPLTTCPNCGGDLRKVFGAVGIVLKGSGFYRTDSRSNGTRPAGRSDKDKKEHAGDAAAPSTSSGSSSEAGSGSTASSESSSGSAEAAPAPAKAAAAG